MNRRDVLKTAAAAAVLGMSDFPWAWAAGLDAAGDQAASPKARVLMFTRSQGYEHSVVKRKGDQLSLAENIVTDLSKKHGFEVHCTKDGGEFTPENIEKYNVFLFETTGDLTARGGDGNPPMSKEGKDAFLKAIADGKGFVGCHCASDTFHSHGPGGENQEPDKRDPYIQMLGGEFITHGAQQKAWMRVADEGFPGLKRIKDYDMNEEWYALKNFADNLHVILIQDTKGMTGPMYQRPPYPATWARLHHKGHVFFTSMGHREDVWESDIFHQVLLAGINWAAGNVKADVTPNIEKVTPEASQLHGEKKS